MKKLRISFFLLLFIFSLPLCRSNLFGQLPSWIWSKSSTGGDGSGQGVATDNLGNGYVCGHYSTNISFGPFPLINNTNKDIFLVKYNSAGSVSWARGIGDSGIEGGTDIVVENSGYIIFTGSFGSASINFGGITLTGAGSMFVAKYDSSGNVVWAKNAATGSGESIACDRDGFIYVAGRFSPTITFGTTVLTSSGGDDIFVAKYSPSGNFLWAKGYGGSTDDAAYEIVISDNDQLLLTGVFGSSSVNFDGHSVNQFGVKSVFVTALDTSGVAQWAKSGGGSGETWGFGIASDTEGSVYATGYFDNTNCIFDGDTLLNAGMGSSRDVFLVKYDSVGNHLWSRRAGGAGSEIADDLASDMNNGVYLCGYFASDSIRFGANPSLLNTGAGSFDVFIAKYDALGNAFWSKKAEGTGGDNGYGLDVNEDGITLITGHYDSNPFSFGATPALTDPGVFLAKLDSSSVYDSITVVSVDVADSDKFLLYPNPSNGLFILQGDFDLISSLEVFSMEGKKIWSCSDFNSNRFFIEIDLTQHPTGVFLLKLNSAEGPITRKLIRR